MIAKSVTLSLELNSYDTAIQTCSWMCIKYCL